MQIHIGIFVRIPEMDKVVVSVKHVPDAVYPLKFLESKVVCIVAVIHIKHIVVVDRIPLMRGIVRVDELFAAVEIVVPRVTFRNVSLVELGLCFAHLSLSCSDFLMFFLSAKKYLPKEPLIARNAQVKIATGTTIHPLISVDIFRLSSWLNLQKTIGHNFSRLIRQIITYFRPFLKLRESPEFPHAFARKFSARQPKIPRKSPRNFAEKLARKSPSKFRKKQKSPIPRRFRSGQSLAIFSRLSRPRRISR
jgi:hypothetical protein